MVRKYKEGTTGAEFSEREFKVVGTRPQRPDGIDKVTGRAMFGADLTAPGMLHATILRSPHAHARIVSIDTSAALAMDGVKAIVTSEDFVKQSSSGNQDTLDNCMARDKVFYDGHAIAAIAATNVTVANAALKLIKVEYEVLPHETDVDAAMLDSAPILHEGRNFRNIPEGNNGNVSGFWEFGHGDVDEGFSKADLILERSFKTAATHQGYIEPHATLATMGPDGRGEIWVCTQGHYMVRDMSAAFVGMEASQLRV
ncbi:MAG: molybdopterin cofactor-binding domain-containing protein, partial [Paracoccaceae bacterium]